MTDTNLTGSSMVKPAGKRRFTKVEKQRIVAECEAADGSTERGMVLRRWGTYQQNISRWRKDVVMADPNKTKPASPADAGLVKQLAAVEAKLAAADDRVELVEELVQAQGKVVGLHAKNPGSPPRV